MNLKRKVEREALKAQRKEVKSAMKSISAAADSMPKACTSCGASFDTKAHPEQLDTWRVQIGEGTFKLTCEECNRGEA